MRRGQFASTFGLAALLSTGALILPSCSSGSGGGGGGFAIVSSSLGWNGDGCSTNQIPPNMPITVTFNQELLPSSVAPSTVSVVEASTGSSPAVLVQIDPDDARRLIISPQIVFKDGKPEALPVGTPVLVSISGSPSLVTIKSMKGESLEQGFSCPVVAEGSFVDVVPGAPDVTLTQPQDGSSNNDGMGSIVLRFSDLMVPATLLSTDFGSPSVFIEQDVDGDESTTADRIPAQGSFTLNFPQPNVTELIFTPSLSLAGSTVRLVTVTVLPSATDILGNAVANPGVFSFTVDALDPSEAEVVVKESFDTTLREDNLRSSALWGVTVPGELQPNYVGGLGILEDLIVLGNEEVVLDTDGVVYELPGISPDGINVCNASPIGKENSALPVPVNNDCQDVSLFNTIWIDNGLLPLGDHKEFSYAGGSLFFSSLQIINGGTLRIQGSRPFRAFVQGKVEIRGTLDASGQGPEKNAPDLFTGDSTVDIGGDGGEAGPGGGFGGRGGDAPDVPLAVVDGQPGEGRGKATAGTLGGGGGSFAEPFFSTGSSALEINVTYDPSVTAKFCEAAAATSGAGGGGYVIAGENGGVEDQKGLAGPAGIGGTDLAGFDPFSNPYANSFVGGAGGGGTGVAPNKSSWDMELLCPLLPGFGAPGQSCTDPIGTTPGVSPCYGPGATFPDLASLMADTGCLTGCFETSFLVNATCCTEPAGGFVPEWVPGPGGGGGGGAVLIQSGRDVLLTGSVSVDGGAGGRGKGPELFDPVIGVGAGGGSAGSVLLQASRGMQVLAPDSIRAKGGAGGPGKAKGGDGSDGLIRLEVGADSGLASPLADSLSPEWDGIVDPAPQVGTSLNIPAGCPELLLDYLGDALPPISDGGLFCLDKKSVAVSKYYEIDKFFLNYGIARYELDIKFASGAVQTFSFPMPAADPSKPAGIGMKFFTGKVPIGVYFQGARRGPDGNPVLGSNTFWLLDARDLGKNLCPGGNKPQLFRFAVVFDGTYSGPFSTESIQEVRVIVKAN